MGRKSRGKGTTGGSDADAPAKAGSGRMIALAVVVAAAVGLAVASWRSAPPTEAPPAATPAPARRVAPPEPPPRAPAPAAAVSMEAPEKYRPLLGEWRRPDGGYVLAVTSVAEDGTASAGYFNPQPINVGRAEARIEEGALGLFVEMRDRNYPGSTYTLTYDPLADQLVGVYFQAVQRASYDVVFVRR